jgi:hypothetical protein
VHVDRGEKMRIYSQVWRTSAYFLFDPETEQLEGYRLDATARRFVPLEADSNGDFDVAVLGLKLGLRATAYRQHERRFVRWLDLTGVPLPTGAERADAEQARADVERERADAERERADAERRRADELEARLRALKQGRE